MKSSINYILFFLLLTAISACSDDDVKSNPTEGLTKIAEAYALGAAAKVELWAEQDLFAGFNDLFVALYDSVDGDRIIESHVTLSPVMTMESGMKHSCPVINPEGEDAVKELFPAAAIFIMPGSDMSYWTMNVKVHNHHTEKFGTASFEIDVVNPSLTQVKSFTDESGDKMFVSYNFPADKKVGVNDFNVHVYKMESGMEFNADDDYSITLEPEMPSMGHGSPNNVNPTYSDNKQCYQGKVNFTMTGEWRLNLTLTKEGESQSLFFDVVLD